MIFQISEMPLLLVLLNILRRPLCILSLMNSWKKGMNMQLCSTHGDAAQGVKYLCFFSSGSLKMRENYISFAQLCSCAQFVYFLREVCYFSMIKFTIMSKTRTYHSKIEK